MVQVNKDVLKPTLGEFGRLAARFWKAVWPKQMNPWEGEGTVQRF